MAATHPRFGTSQQREGNRDTDLWGRHATTWADMLEPQMRPLYDAVLDTLEPLAGRKVLDAGCGTGLAVKLASERGAVAAGLDASPGLLEVARDRMGDADLRVGDIEALPFGDGAFDIVTANNAIQYAKDQSIAVAELARVCKTGGGVAIGAWGEPARCETARMLRQLSGLAPTRPGTPAPLAVSDRGVVENLLDTAGLDITGTAEVACPFSFTTIDEAWTAHKAGGPIQHVIDIVGHDTVRALFADLVEADRKPDGQLRQDNVFRYVTAVKPSTARHGRTRRPHGETDE